MGSRNSIKGTMMKTLKGTRRNMSANVPLNCIGIEKVIQSSV